jgi:hypothetical protein
MVEAPALERLDSCLQSDQLRLERIKVFTRDEVESLPSLLHPFLEAVHRFANGLARPLRAEVAALDRFLKRFLYRVLESRKDPQAGSNPLSQAFRRPTPLALVLFSHRSSLGTWKGLLVRVSSLARVHPLDVRSQRAEPLIDPLVPALDLARIINLALPFGTQCGDE